MARDPWKWTLSDIKRLIRNSIQESVDLDYKSGKALTKKDSSKDEVSKDVSSFANAGGGTLIYGIMEVNKLPVEIDGVIQKDVDREWLEQVIHSRIRPKIDGIRIRPIPTGKPGKVLYVVWVPQSDRAPHQASDRKYYTRRNFQAEPMEDYEIRDVLMRKRAPNILLDFFFRRHKAHVDRFPIDWTNPETLHQIEINGEIWNEGGGEVHNALITLTMDARLLSGNVIYGPHTSMTAPNQPAWIDHPVEKLWVEIRGERVEVRQMRIPWKGPDNLPLFRSVRFRLFHHDLPISFKKQWVEDANPQFLLWDVRAPEMEPRTGYIALKRDGDDVFLKKQEAPPIGGFTQDNHRRRFLSSPDLSYGPSG